MPFSLRRIACSFLAVLACLAAGSSLKAYPVNITINTTFVSIPGDPDPLGLGTANPPIQATLTTTLESSLPAASYPASVTLTIPGLFSGTQSGSLSISPDGQISATFSGTQGSFNAVLVLPLAFPNPVPLAFGTTSFSSPASSVQYNLFGETGTVGVNGTISALGLTASPTSIASSYTVGGAAPAAATINVTSNDPTNPSQAYTVAVANAATPFLTLSATGGTTPGSLSATFSTTVPAGTYTADVQISSGGGAPLSIPVTYTVAAAGGGGGGTPVLQISPSLLTFTFITPGSTSQTQTLSITSPVAASYTASVSAGSNFLTLGSTAGSTPGSVTVTANPGSLAVGIYSGSILFTSPTAPSVTVPVTLNNGTAGGGGGGGGNTTLTVLPTLLRFSYVVGQPAPPAQSFTISNPTPVSFTVTNVAFYLAITPTTGNTTASISVNFNPAAGLAPGSYTDDVTFTSSAGGSLMVPVIVTVTAAPLPVLSAAPTTLSFTYTGTAPAPQTIAISGTSALSYTVATTSPWLTVSPASGATPGSITVTASATGLATGNYTGTIVITAPGAGNTPLSIPLTFSVTQPVPTLTATPAAISFAYTVGGTTPAAQTVTTSGTGGIPSTLTPIAASWLTVTQSGTSATLTANPAGLAAGTYVGSLNVTSTTAGVAPIFIPVTLTVSSGTAIGVSSAELTFSGAAASTPTPQVLAVATSDGSSLAVTSDSPWLTVSSASVSSGDITVTATPGTMPAGTYQGNVILTGTGTPAQVVTVPVTLNIGSTATPALTAVANGISFQNTTGSPGLIVALFGTGLGPTTAATLSVSPANTLTTNVGGTQVIVDGIPCPILFSSATQVNAVLPFALDGQTTASVQLFYQGVSGGTITIPIQPVTPSIFTSNASGQGGGAILNQDLSVNSASNPAAAGTIIAVYGGGGGETNPLGADGLLIPIVTPFPTPAQPATSVTIGGQPAQVLYYGAAPGLVDGVLQLNATIPAGTPSGPQPIVINVGTVSSQPGVTVYVQ